jgi:hypothetical protein
MPEAARNRPQEETGRNDSGVRKIPDLKSVPKKEGEEYTELDVSDLEEIPNKTADAMEELTDFSAARPPSLPNEAKRADVDEVSRQIPVSDADKMAIEKDFNQMQRIPRAKEIMEMKKFENRDAVKQQKEQAIARKERMINGGPDYAAEVQAIADSGKPNYAADVKRIMEEGYPPVGAETQVDVVAKAEAAKIPDMAPDEKMAAMKRMDTLAHGIIELEHGANNVKSLEEGLFAKYGYEPEAAQGLGDRIKTGWKSMFNTGFRAMKKTYEMRLNELNDKKEEFDLLNLQVHDPAAFKSYQSGRADRGVIRSANAEDGTRSQ